MSKDISAGKDNLESTIIYGNTTEDDKCKCCNGTGIQYSWITGLKDICPACQGTGHWSNAIATVRYGFS